MKKRFLAAIAGLGMILTLSACSGNAGTAAINDTVDMEIENQSDIQTGNQDNAHIEDGIEEQVDMREENKIDVQTGYQDNAQIEARAGVQEENEEDSLDNSEPTADDNESENEEETGEQTEMKMNVQIGDYKFTATLEANKAVEELVDMMKDGPVTISMDDYSGFEKVGPLGRSLTTSNSQTTTDAGDIVLYNGNNIVMFYGSNSWSYTRIGKIDDLTNWNKALGSGSITAIFTFEE